MNALAKTGLVVGGLAFLFKDQLVSALFSGAGIAPTPQPGTIPADPRLAPPHGTPPPIVPTPSARPPDVSAPVPPRPAAPATSLESIVMRIRQINGQRRLASADEWNFYYSQASGIPQTADLFTAGNRGEEITLSEYLARRGAAGLSGLTNLGRVR